MIALAAMLVLAVCGAMQTPALSAVASNAVQCVTTFECSHAGAAPQPAAGPVRAATPAAATSGGPAATAQSQGAVARQLPGTLGAATSAGIWSTNPLVRSPLPWRPYPIGRLVAPWLPYPVPLPPRVVSCEVSVGCN